MAAPWPLYLLVALILLLAYRHRRRSPRLPPGPRPLPVLGNALNFPRRHLGREFRDLSDKHGDVVYLKVLGQSIILLGSFEAACEILEKRSANYSNRPESVMVNLTHLDWIFVFKNYGPEWRKYRRMFHHQFLPELRVGYQDIQYQVTCDLLRNLLETPEQFSSHIKFAFAAVILRIVYGADVVHGDKRHYSLAKELAHIAEDISTPGRHLVEALPLLQKLPAWLPGGGVNQLAATWKERIVAIRDELFDAAKERIGVTESTICRLMQEGEDEQVARNVTATIYAAGADTINASVHAFFLAMALHPEAQKKAQAELDAICGANRLPQFSDRDSLPYVNALIKEVLRWHIVAPIGVPHRSENDDEYNGYFIPAGSIVMANAWAFSRDEMMYPDPERFDPDRFLLNGQTNPAIRDPSSYAFGFGRRICPGKVFGEASLFLVCTSVLHTLNITPPVDEKGCFEQLDVDMGYNLAVSHPESFRCQILPRDAQRAKLIFSASSAC